MKEIEVLFSLQSTKKEALQALSFLVSKGIQKTIDTYYYDPLRKELAPEKDGRLTNSLRVREKNGVFFLTYKNDHFINTTWSHSDEFETKIENGSTLKEILSRLGFIELIRIENEKTIFETDVHEIALEDVTDLGLFIEIELKQQIKDEDIAQAKQAMRDFIESLGIQTLQEENAGKPELLIKKMMN